MTDYAARLQAEVAEINAAWQQGHAAGRQAALDQDPAGPASESLPNGFPSSALSAASQAYRSGWYVGYHDGYQEAQGRRPDRP